MTRPREYTDEALLVALRTFYEKHNRPPTRREQRGMSINGVPSRSTLIQRFGTASTAFALAGVPTNPHGGRIIHGRYKHKRRKYVRPVAIDPSEATRITQRKQEFWRQVAKGKHGLDWTHPYARRFA